MPALDALPPRPLLAVCLVLLGGLAWTVEERDLPLILPAEAPLWEGQAVRLEGWAQAVVPAPDGSLRLRLVDGPHAVAARLPAGDGAAVALGERIAVAGRLLRSPAGDLQLLVEEADSLRRLAGPDPADPGWEQVAADPDAWAGRPLQLRGTVEDGHLNGPRIAVRLGEGPWPRTGATEAVAFLRYEEGCLCHVADAREVRPWTA